MRHGARQEVRRLGERVDHPLRRAGRHERGHQRRQRPPEVFTRRSRDTREKTRRGRGCRRAVPPGLSQVRRNRVIRVVKPNPNPTRVWDGRVAEGSEGWRGLAKRGPGPSAPPSGGHARLRERLRELGHGDPAIRGVASGRTSRVPLAANLSEHPRRGARVHPGASLERAHAKRVPRGEELATAREQHRGAAVAGEVRPHEVQHGELGPVCRIVARFGKKLEHLQPARAERGHQRRPAAERLKVLSG